MADDEEISVRPDVPTTGAIVKTPRAADALARRMAGEEPPDECRFACVMCGWDKTLYFDPDEIEALGGDITSYGGPCPTHDGGCGSMTLVPRDRLLGDDFKPAIQRAREARREEFQEGADIFVDTLKREVAEVVGGSIFQPKPIPGADPAMPPVSGPPRDDLPSADDIDPSDLTPRGDG